MRTQIIKILKKIISPSIAIEVFYPSREKFGHYTTNVAFKLAPVLKKSPTEIANDLILKIKREDKKGLFKKIENVSGFINFWISESFWQKKVKEILKEKNYYGRLKLGQKKFVQIEFISANPTGPLTLANARGGFFGDVLANVLETAGFKVEREYYVNDVGNQILLLGKSLLAQNGFLNWEENFYQGDYLKKWAKENFSFIKKNKNDPLKIGQKAARDFLADIKMVLKKAGIHFDRYTSERKDILEKGFSKKALEIFQKANLVYKKEGAVWLKTKKFGDDKDRVLLTKENEPTYFLNDAGHYLETKKRGFVKKINILGPDHYGYVKRIQAAAKILGLKDSVVIITQAIRIVEKGKGIKMSKRRGKFVTLKDLLKEIKPEVARFFFLTVSSDSHLDFDLSLARQRSLKNPVYYLEYAYVRSRGILKKARVKNFNLQYPLSLNSEKAMQLTQTLLQFKEVIEEVAKSYEVHRLTLYSQKLAFSFHQFYEKERVIKKDGSVDLSLWALTKASFLVLKNLINLLGLKPPKKM